MAGPKTFSSRKEARLVARAFLVIETKTRFGIKARFCSLSSAPWALS